MGWSPKRAFNRRILRVSSVELFKCRCSRISPSCLSLFIWMSHRLRWNGMVCTCDHSCSSVISLVGEVATHEVCATYSMSGLQSWPIYLSLCGRRQDPNVRRICKVQGIYQFMLRACSQGCIALGEHPAAEMPKHWAYAGDKPTSRSWVS